MDEQEALLAQVYGEEPEPEKAYDISEKYWLRKPYYSEEYAAEMLDKVQSLRSGWQTTRLGSALCKAYRTYHNMDEDSEVPNVSITTAGEDDELIYMRVNQYRNLVHHQLALTAGSRPAWDPQARTSDSESAKQVTMARNILDYVMSAKEFEKKLYAQDEAAVVLASAFFVMGWDANAGLKGSGDIWGRVMMPWEVWHERTRDYSDVKCWIFCKYESRWDWAEKFSKDDPEKAEKIAGISVSMDVQVNYESEESDDSIPVWYVYAMPSLALPDGRMSMVTSENIVLFDGPNPYGDTEMVVRMNPSEFLGTSQPFADSWSLLIVNDSYNDVLSTIMTRIDAFGIPNVTKPQGSEMEAEDAGGMRMIEHPIGSESPKVLDLLTIPPELPNMLGLIKGLGEDLSGINSVSRGNPAENIKSGAMAALVQSMSIQYNSPLETAVNATREKVGTAVIKIFQRMATEKQLISICGKDQAWTCAEFTNEDIKDIMRVSVKTVNALSKTTAGRSDIADKLLERGVISSPQEYMNIIATGNVDPFFAGPVNALSSIKAENEKMMAGEPAKVFVYENHELHIKEHLNDVDANMKERPDVMQLFSQHVQEHFLMWQKLSREQPDMLEATGQKVLPAAQAVGQQMMAMEGAAPPEPGARPNPTQEPNTEKPSGKAGRPPSSGAAPGQEPPGQPNLPKPAKNPMTGEAPTGAHNG